MKKLFVIISILFCQMTVSMALSTLNDISTQSAIVESAENDFNDLSTTVEDTNIGMYEYVEQAAMAMSAKEIVIGVFLIFIGALIGGSLVYYYSKRKIHNILQEERVYYLDYPPLKTEKSIFHYITLFHVLKKRKDSYKRHNTELKMEMDELEAENASLKGKIAIGREKLTI